MPSNFQDMCIGSGNIGAHVQRRVEVEQDGDFVNVSTGMTGGAGIFGEPRLVTLSLVEV